MSTNQYFRAGVGVVLYTDQKQIYLFRRTDLPNVWQFPQGGMDAGETPETTLWRELKEETGLTAEAIATVTQYPDLLHYAYDQNLRHTLRDPNCLGQIHTWFFLKVTPGTTIDLTTASDDEFIEYKLADFDTLLELADPLKNHVYEALAQHLATKL